MKMILFVVFILYPSLSCANKCFLTDDQRDELAILDNPLILPGSGGVISAPKEFPHMAVIGYGDKENIQWLCGGSLISRKLVLTAAHCVVGNVPKFVRIGDLDITSNEDGVSPQNFTVLKIFPHPLYNPPEQYYDIALLELDSEVIFDPFVRPICINTEEKINDTDLTATGWGNTGYAEPNSNILLKIDMKYVPWTDCMSALGPRFKKSFPGRLDHAIHICARGRTKIQDTCQGDSGGPLLINRDVPYKHHHIIGIISYGKACGLSGLPGIYTRVSYYIPWIESILKTSENRTLIESST